MKIKTYKGLAKRIKKTGSKKKLKLMHQPKGDNHHLRTKKNAKRRNRMAGEKNLDLTANYKALLKHLG